MNYTLRFVRWLATKLQRRDFRTPDGSLYLSRYCVLGWMPGSKWRWPFSVYLHQIHRPDHDRALHNHPWAKAWSCVLHGGYAEVRFCPGARDVWMGDENLPFVDGVRFPGDLFRVNSDTFHCINSVRPDTWTLFVTWRVTQSWGFKVPGRGFVPWRKRLAEYETER